MKVFGLWERLTKIIFFKGKQVAIEPATQTGAADKTISVPDMASNASQEMVLSDQAQTLANKTLTSPVVSGTAVTPGAGKVNLAAAANQLQITDENGRRAGISTASLTGAKTFVLPDNSGNIVTTGDTGSITSAMIANGTIKDEDISSVPADRIAGSKVSPDFVAQNVVTTGSVTGNSVVVSGSLLGTGAGNALTIGDSDDTITIPGSLIVQGTTTSVDTTNLEVKDKLVTLNNGGLAASGGGTGIEVEENNAVTGYAKVTSDRNGWELKAPNSANVVTIPNSVAAGNVVLDAGTQTIGGSKTFSSDLTLSSTGSLKLPVGTDGQRPTAVQGMVRYNITQNSFEGYDGSTWAGLGGGGTTDRITQANSFNIGDVVYLNGSTYTAAIATAANTAEVAGVVSKIVTAGTVFEITLVGEVSNILQTRFDEGTLPAPGEVVFLSPTNPGKLTITEPSVVGQVSVPVGIVSGWGSVYVQPKRGAVVGGANLRTQIGLSNNTTTNIQNITGYRSGEIAGDVFIDATADYKFGIKAQFVKDAAGAWKVSFQTWGDTPPQGFKVDAATVASVDYLQVTMPNVAGFDAATSNINFALNAPAVGATLPLQIASTSVSFTDIQAASSAGITFKEDGGTPTMAITDAGNVGIGTSSPSSKFEVKDSSTNCAGTVTSANSSIQLQSNATDGYMNMIGAGNLIFRVGNPVAEYARFSQYNNTTSNSVFRINTSLDSSQSFNTNCRVHMQGGLQITHTGNSARWRQLNWSGDTADGSLYFPNGTNTATLTAAGAWVNASDARLKTDVVECKHGLSSVLSSKPSSYRRIDCDGEFVGFIAQELKEIIPEVVNGTEETQYGVDYGSLVAVAFKAIQEQQAQIEELKAKIVALEGK